MYAFHGGFPVVTEKLCEASHNFSYAKFRVMPSRIYSKLTQSECEAQTTFHNHGPSNDALHASEAIRHGLKCLSGLGGALKTGDPPARTDLKGGAILCKVNSAFCAKKHLILGRLPLPLATGFA